MKERLLKLKDKIAYRLHRIRVGLTIMKFHSLRTLGFDKKAPEGVMVGINAATGQIALKTHYSNGDESVVIISSDMSMEIGNELINAAKAVTIV